LNSYLALISLFILLAGCAPSGGSDLPDDLAVCESVLRHEWGNRSLEANDGISGFYLAKGDADFPDAFYEHFKDNTPTVYKLSELPISFDSVKHSIWTAYWVWSFEPPERLRPDAFTVRGGYQCGETCKSSCQYTVIRKNGRWVVDEVDQCERP
jgi:hypothetical protein